MLAIFYDFYSDIWSCSPATESIQAGLKAAKRLNTSGDEDIDPFERDFNENNDVELREEEDLRDFKYPFLFNKIYYPHLHLFNHFLLKLVIKRHKDKLFERKKCCKIADITEFIENSQRHKLVQIRRKKISAKLSREDEEVGHSFRESM